MDELPPPTSRSNPLSFRPVLILLVLLAFLGGIYLFVTKGNLSFLNKAKKTQGSAALEYWGLFEPQEVVAPLIKEYQDSHPGVTINYQQKTYTDLESYQQTLLTRSSQGTGPDIFRFHASWMAPLAKVLSPAPEAVFTKADYESTFYQAASQNLISQDKVYGVPLMYEGLALFYDPVRLESVGAAAPETWEEFRDIALKLTEYEGETRKIKRSGAAIGVASNVDHASDILGLMLAQSGVKYPDEIDSVKAQDALTYYTNFVVQDKIWDAAFPNSLQAFANGQVAMIFAPSWRIFDILSLNPRLNFKVAAVPQIPRYEERYGRVGWASFWAEGVSKYSQAPDAAWEFLKFLSSKESQQKLYAKEATLRPFGEWYSRKEMKESLMGDANAQAFLKDAETAVMWPITSASGNNKAVEAIETAIDAVVKGVSPVSAMPTLKANLTGTPPPRQ